MRRLGKLKAEERMSKIRLLVRGLTFIVFLAVVAGVIYLYSQGYLTDKMKMQRVVTSAGIFGPLVFLVFQILQTIVPILPGGVSSVAGVMIFGSVWGFVLNYIGIVIGSTCCFYIARIFGRPILEIFFSPKSIATYEKHTNSESAFQRYFALMIFIPVAPDDLICYLAGTTSMKFRKFITVILLGKPLALFLYSEGLAWILHFLFGIG